MLTDFRGWFCKSFVGILEYRNFILCSEYSAGPDIIKKYKNGMIIDPKNTTQFTKKIIKAININNRNNVNLSKIKDLNKIYNWENINKKLIFKL